MNITFLIGAMAKHGGGPPREVANLSARLAQLPGVSVRVLATGSGDNVATAPGVQAVWLARPVAGAANLLANARILRATLRGSDFVFVWGVWGALEGALFRFLRARRCRYAVKTLGMLEAYIMSRNRGRKRLARALYVGPNLSQASAILVDSLPERARVQELGFTNRIEICRNGVAIPPDLGLPRLAGSFVYLGRITPKKGLDFFLPVLARLRPRHPRLKLVVAGPFDAPDYERAIRSQVDGLGLADAVSFVGQVDGAEKDRLLQQSVGFILPSHSEGFSNAVLEALAAGTPVFITPGCNFPEVDADRLGYVIPREPEAWEAALAEFLATDPRHLREAARIRAHMAEQFNWDATARKLLALAGEPR